MDKYALLFSSVSVVLCSIFFSCMQLLFLHLVHSFHMLVQTHAPGKIPFPIAQFPVINACEQQALVSEHMPKYLCTCHGNTCCFYFIFHGGLFLRCQVFLPEVLFLLPWQQTWQVLFGGCYLLADFYPFLLV